MASQPFNRRDCYSLDHLFVLKCFKNDCQVGELIAVMAEDGEDWKTVAASSASGTASSPAPTPASGKYMMFLKGSLALA